MLEEVSEDKVSDIKPLTNFFSCFFNQLFITLSHKEDKLLVAVQCGKIWTFFADFVKPSGAATIQFTVN